MAQENGFGRTGYTRGLHEGHRMRLIAKLDSNTLCDHELLEMALFNAVPRKNTNDLAHRLLFEFGSIRGVVNASCERLMRVEGVGPSVASYLVFIGKILPPMAASTFTTFPLKFDFESFAPYAKREYHALTEEILDVFLLDSEGAALERKRFRSPEEGMVEVRAKWLQDVIAEGNPSGIVIVHNHPQGESFPSRSDDLTTEKCQYLCNNAGILFCNHFIYSKKGLYSYRDSGMLLRIAQNCALQNAGGLDFTRRSE